MPPAAPYKAGMHTGQGLPRHPAGFPAPTLPAPHPARPHGNGHAAAPAPAVAPDACADIPLEDWNDLFTAVKERLRVLGQGLQRPDGRASLGVLECAEALDQLHTTLLHELARRRRFELELFDARLALALSRAALAGTRDGERQARHEALHDSLTGLPNRRQFRDRLAQALSPSLTPRSPLCVFYLDLDDFKPVNDRHGHATGDELLRIVAARLTRALRAEDLVARIGGDEFACLITDMPGPAPLDALARKLYDTIAAPVTVGKLELAVHASIGIAMCPHDASTADALLRCADAAMYRAKRLRLRHACFDARIDDREHVSAPSPDR
jgi:diguanylate cyclase (GGDEF)-like protein